MVLVPVDAPADPSKDGLQLQEPLRGGRVDGHEVPVDDREEDVREHAVHEDEVGEHERRHQPIHCPQLCEVEVPEDEAEAEDNRAHEGGAVRHVLAERDESQHDKPCHRDEEHDHEPPQVHCGVPQGLVHLRKSRVLARELQRPDADHHYVHRGQPVVQSRLCNEPNAVRQEISQRFVFDIVELGVLVRPPDEEPCGEKRDADGNDLQKVEDIETHEVPSDLDVRGEPLPRFFRVRRSLPHLVPELLLSEVCAHGLNEHARQEHVQYPWEDSRHDARDVLVPLVEIEQLHGVDCEIHLHLPAGEHLEGDGDIAENLPVRVLHRKVDDPCGRLGCEEVVGHEKLELRQERRAVRVHDAHEAAVTSVARGIAFWDHAAEALQRLGEREGRAVFQGRRGRLVGIDGGDDAGLRQYLRDGLAVLQLSVEPQPLRGLIALAALVVLLKCAALCDADHLLHVRLLTARAARLVHLVQGHRREEAIPSLQAHCRLVIDAKLHG
mmetsp:Transcript_96343/g.278099  ORF Transcript_96343/g.278099 Transcript_96343/m.278099 type:complete len:496 (+) Transcript_96343:850-2337(+)